MATTSQYASAGRWGMFAMFFVLMPATLAEPGPPREQRDGLGSDDFKQREEAQAGMLAWGRKKPKEAKEWFYLRSTEDPDPEIRRRCHAILRDLVLDDYLKDGEGYAGITMQVMAVVVPGDAGQRFGIRAIQVVPGGAAAKGGLIAGDVIVGVGGRTWNDASADRDFQTWIRSQKPGTKVMVKLLRQNRVVEVPLVLARRPVGLEALMPFGVKPDEARRLDQEAKDAYFLKWLEQRAARK